MQLTVSVDLLHSVFVIQLVVLIANTQVLRALSLHDCVFLVYRHCALYRRNGTGYAIHRFFDGINTAVGDLASASSVHEEARGLQV